MLALNALNNIIYKVFNESNNENINKLSGIYTFLPKDVIFPYLFIECTNIEQQDNYIEQIYKININFNIYDNSNSCTNILNITNSIKNIIMELKHSNILDIKILNMENQFNNNLIPYYKSVLKIEFLFKI